MIDAGASCPPNVTGQLHRCGSPTCAVSGVGQALPCKSDSDCELDDAGVLYEGTCAAGVCRLDQCFTDSDCPMGTACNCADDWGPTAGRNWCLPANCRTDGDCGPGGVCSPSIQSGYCGNGGEVVGFYCHTPRDTCATDADCGGQGSATSCQYVTPPLCDSGVCIGGPGYWTCLYAGCGRSG